MVALRGPGLWAGSLHAFGARGVTASVGLQVSLMPLAARGRADVVQRSWETTRTAAGLPQEPAATATGRHLCCGPRAAAAGPFRA
jgi:hypothetical protein